MRAAAAKGRTERLNVRVTAAQAKLIRLAAEETETNLSAFLVESACLRAEEALAAKQHLVYSPAQWDRFVAMLDRPALDPARDKPRLRKLLHEPSVLEAGKTDKR
jgi:uncharacterized protein (DUF1778 family)